jgi:RIO-like serine/threonine protein kinase
MLPTAMTVIYGMQTQLQLAQAKAKVRAELDLAQAEFQALAALAHAGVRPPKPKASKSHCASCGAPDDGEPVCSYCTTVREL